MSRLEVILIECTCPAPCELVKWYLQLLQNFNITFFSCSWFNPCSWFNCNPCYYIFRVLYSSRLAGYFGATNTVKLYWKQISGHTPWYPSSFLLRIFYSPLDTKELPAITHNTWIMSLSKVIYPFWLLVHKHNQTCCCVLRACLRLSLAFSTYLSIAFTVLYLFMETGEIIIGDRWIHDYCYGIIANLIKPIAQPETNQDLN